MTTTCWSSLQTVAATSSLARVPRPASIAHTSVPGPWSLRHSSSAPKCGEWTTSPSTLTNKEIIAINQDPLGQWGKLEGSGYNGTLQNYAKNLSDGSVAELGQHDGRDGDASAELQEVEEMEGEGSLGA
ncbi:uncharacterized protein K444DRAFT_432613 [Hyaloscypha bicolor E]|uniref:Uncharacterized protein n=1 Tax=Hyaloscypha bicolor E TaxID=1095630 RepID=A0A2J6T5Z5_9HELO|nr:uncharacterized protein K444DRAFT_432613 [Hyaloscypha bicolor E]PMD58442.1 hypothetical protein K444DRAFT_432613 [Hyaloscypha bicolor E]